MDRGAWWAAVHGVAKSRAERLDFHALEKEMATHSSALAWRIPEHFKWYMEAYKIYLAVCFGLTLTTFFISLGFGEKGKG